VSPRRVIVIGAARSGTKLLRDTLAAATGAGRVPYDISYVWRYGNEAKTDDVLEASDMSVRTSRYIQHYVDRYAEGDPATVVEKTVGNTLRVPAVAAVFPDAVFVHVIRDGVDVIESTRRQWTQPSDFRYLARKARHFPLRLVPGYGTKYLRSLARRRFGSAGHVDTWGPRYPGIDDDVARGDLLTVCARQWHECVVRAQASFDELHLPVREVRYEVLVSQPAETLAGLAEFIGHSPRAGALEAAAALIEPGRSELGRIALSVADARRIDDQVGSLLKSLLYDPPRPSTSPSTDEQGSD